MLRRTRLLVRLLTLLASGRRVAGPEFAAEYDHVAPTYDRWSARMGRHVEGLLESCSLPARGRVLDLACGTGFASRWIAARCPDVEITAVDISEGMLRRLQPTPDQRIRKVAREGLCFLRETDDRYDAMICAWALPYFDRAALLRELARHTEEGGVVAMITNIRGTLRGLREAMLDVMADRIADVDRILTISSNLPRGAEDLSRRFTTHGFRALHVAEGVEEVSFDEPRHLLEWLLETGAAAGTGAIFRDEKIIESELVTRLAMRMRRGEGYSVNHRFAHGVFQKG